MFANDATGSFENGMALFNAIGNYIRGNMFHQNPQGGIFIATFTGTGTNTVAAITRHSGTICLSRVERKPDSYFSELQNGPGRLKRLNTHRTSARPPVLMLRARYSFQELEDIQLKPRTPESNP